MAEYTYSKFYKDLSAQQEILEKNFKKLFEKDSREEQMILWLEEYKKTHESILEMADDEIGDIEWQKDDEINDLTREIRDLESKENRFRHKKDERFGIESLEDEMKVELFQAAMKKYTLVQLEERLGNKFELI